MNWNYDFTTALIPLLAILLVIISYIILVKMEGNIGGRGTSVVFVKKPLVETRVEGFSTPAAVREIKDLGNSTVELDIQSHLEHCTLMAYWGVSIKDFPWSDGEPPHQHKEEHVLGYLGSHQLHLDVQECELGDQPRTHYHLVTVISSPEAESKLYSIYHLYGCSLKTSVLKQYLKCASGQMLVVKTIFDESRCVICMDAPATFTLLPCRHSCICQQCLPHIQQQCPICRVFVESYFVTRADSSSHLS